MAEQGAGTGFEPIRYHQLTKHSPASVRAGIRRLDWMDQPEPFKDYLDIAPLPLPRPAPDTRYPAAKAVLGIPGDRREMDPAELARILVGAAGVLRVRPQPSGKPAYLRTYACAGALYPIEVYIATGGVGSMEAGLYHYSPRDDSLRQLRTGDPRPYLLRAAGGRRSIGAAPVTVILSGIAWRTNWKYQARGYRHLYWDSGMILANLLGLCAAGGHSSEVVLGFDDRELDLLLGIDGRTEMSICMVPIGYDLPASETVVEATAAASPIDHPVGKLSFRQREYPEVAEGHSQTSLRSPEEARFWQQEPFPASPTLPAEIPATGIERVIRRRGSRRMFTPASISKADLEGIIAHSTHDLACDWGLGLTQVGLIVNAVDGLEPGSYSAVYGLEQLGLGDMREKAKFLCLEQDLGGDAAATMFLLTDLEDATANLGKRGYRAAQLNAGIVAGRMYLCAYACGMGATGLTFYDDEVRSFFRTQADPMLVVAVGH